MTDVLSPEVLERLPSDGVLLVVVLGMVLAMLGAVAGGSVQIIRLVLEQRDRRGRREREEAAACLFPAGLGDRLGAAVGMQQPLATATALSIERLSESMERLANRLDANSERNVDAFATLTGKVVEALAEIRAGRR